MLLGLFTDETAYFLILLLVLFIGHRDGLKNILRPQFFTDIVICSILLAGLSIGTYFLVMSLPQQHLFFGIVNEATTHLKSYWTKPLPIFVDLSKAFFAYFLRRDFGYWDSTFLGILSALSASALFILGFCFKCWSRRIGLIILSIAGIILLKALILPHNSGVHGEPIMPFGTFYPSLFFFSYYYVYVEAVLLSIVAGLFLNGAANQNKKIFLVILVGIFLMGLSSVVHLRNGPEDTLRYHLLWDPWRQQPAKDILDFEKQLKKLNAPVYTSYKNGDQPLALGHIDDANKASPYSQYILQRHLKDIRSGIIITSSTNTLPRKPFKYADELSNARMFVDLEQRQYVNLADIRTKFRLESFTPKLIMFKQLATMMSSDGNAKEIVFFLKGSGKFYINANGHEASGEQTYGQSYQIIRLQLKDAGITMPLLVKLVVVPEDGQTSYLVGPFAL